MTDSQSDRQPDRQPDGEPDETGEGGKSDSLGTPVEPTKPAYTKAAQPDLPLAQRRQKAGLNRNRIGIWIVVGAFALYLIITGIVGILTKAR